MFQILLIFQMALAFSVRHPLVETTYSHSYEGSQYDNGYTELRYEEVLRVTKSVYSPIIKAIGGEFHILSDWSDGAVNAWAFRYGHEYWLELPGGMSRYHLINEEAFIVTICHELGHLLGGEPRNGDISFEGQADYFSTLECVDKIFAKLPKSKNTIRDEVTDFCSGHSNKNSFCRRSLSGAVSVSSYFAELEGKASPRISTPSTKTVSQTQSSHPKSQCRLDTMVAGYIESERPRCWYFQ